MIRTEPGLFFFKKKKEERINIYNGYFTFLNWGIWLLFILIITICTTSTNHIIVGTQWRLGGEYDGLLLWYTIFFSSCNQGYALVFT